MSRSETSNIPKNVCKKYRKIKDEIALSENRILLLLFTIKFLIMHYLYNIFISIIVSVIFANSSLLQLKKILELCFASTLLKNDDFIIKYPLIYAYLNIMTNGACVVINYYLYFIIF